MLEIDCKSNNVISREVNEKVYYNISTRDNGGLDPSGSHEGEKKGCNYGHFWKQHLQDG